MGKLGVWRAGDSVSVYLGRRLSAHLMVQPVAAAEFLADPIAQGQGFLARFLIAEPPSTIGTRLRRGKSPASEVAIDAFSEKTQRLLEHPMALKDGARNELDPPLLALSDEARELQDYADRVEMAQAPAGAFDAITAFASKSAEQAARIAGVMTVFANPKAREVTGETVAAASISPRSIEKWPDDAISASDAAQRGPFKETEKARSSLRFLQRNGWVEPMKSGALVRGKRRREAWRVIRSAS